MSRKHRRVIQPNTTRRGMQLPPGAVVRPIPTAQAIPYAQNIYGANTVPVDELSGPITAAPATTFLPGDPVRPTPGLDDTNRGPRAWSVPIGSNIAATPRSTEQTRFDQLRQFAINYNVFGLCEDAHNRIIRRLEPRIVPKDGIVPEGEDATLPKWLEPARRMQEWFEDGPSHLLGDTDLHGWMVALHRDSVELDAMCILHEHTRAGYLYALRYIDGATIQVLSDVAGRVPQPPYPAYRQVLYGAPGAVMTTEMMDYLRYTVRTDSLYGLPPLERILFTVNQALRKQSFDLRRFTDGATPSGIIKIAAATNWTVDQVRVYEERFNNILAGNDALRVRVKALPPGGDFIKLDPDEIATEFDRWLMNITVASMGLTMDELSFTETSNRSVGDAQENVTYRNAIKPRSDFYAHYLTRVIRRCDGTPISTTNATVSRPNAPTKGKGEWDARYKLTWGGIEEPEDFSKKAESIKSLYQGGILTRLQAKRELKLPVDQGEEDTPAFIVAQGGMDGVVVLADIDANRKNQQTERDTKSQTAQTALKIQQLQAVSYAKQVEQPAEETQPTGEGESTTGNEGGSESSGGTNESESKAGQDNESGTNSNPRRATFASYGDAGPRGRYLDSAGVDAMGHPDDDDSTTADTRANERTNSLDRDPRTISRRVLVSEHSKIPGIASGGIANKGDRGTTTRDNGDTETTDEAQALAAELRRYQRVAINALKRGKRMPTFQSDVIPTDLHTQLSGRLAVCTVPDEVRAVFALPHAQDCRCTICGCGDPFSDHGKPYPILDSKNDVYENHTGCMVAFFLPTHVSQQLAIPGGCPMSEMHITVAFLGDTKEDDIDKDKLLLTVKEWAANWHVIDVDVNALERFPGNPEDGSPIVARSSSSALHEAHDTIVGALLKVGISVDQKFPEYKPHITIAYIPQDAPSPAIPIPNVHFSLDCVWVAYGDERYAFPLGNVVKQDDETGQRAMKVDILRELKADLMQAMVY